LSTPDTKDRILDTAERLFAEQGYAATSLRSVTSEAEVNLAAVNYHFGSKDALLVALLHRRIDPINTERLEMLSAHEAECAGREPHGTDPRIDVDTILRAFLSPVFRQSRTWEESGTHFLQFIGRIHSVSDDRVRKMIFDLFEEVFLRFLSALERALPELSQEEVFWRLQFVVGSMAHTLLWRRPLIESDYFTWPEPDLDQTIEKLVAFCTNGINAPPDRSTKGGGQ